MKKKIKQNGKTVWQHLNNAAIFICTLATTAFATMILEYEYSKKIAPQVAFINTPTRTDLVFSIPVLILGIINLAMLFIISAKRLDNRKWLWWSVIIQLMLVGVLFYILGTWRVYHIVFPSAPFIELKK